MIDGRALPSCRIRSIGLKRPLPRCGPFSSSGICSDTVRLVWISPAAART